MKRFRSGFTLIELLVVIAIIALLAAILLPVFQAAREKARASSCASNQKQIGLAFMQYTQDYDELFPPFAQGYTSTSPYGTGWVVLLQPYIKSQGVFQCPDDKVGATGTNPIATGYNDYWYNSQIGYGTGASAATMGLSKFTAPATTILTGDGDGNGSNSEGLGSCNSNNESCGAGTALYKENPVGSWGWADLNTLRDFETKHGDGANYSFVDGHVKRIQMMALYQTCNSTPDGTIPTFKVR